MASPILAYHDGTKHHFRAFAPSLSYLDWDTQPNPFRRYTGAPLIRLSHIQPSDFPHYETPFREGEVSPRPVDRETIPQLFYDALAISAW
ncbi:MAG: SagB/ThcOx family dehydrogenase, partial [Nitrospirae bacterium]|nr:SagB/ThcOx family dehydrogenase [Nitrospirota bacterium]